VEQAGLVKFDFLGLRTLTIIDWALKTINAGRAKAGEPPIDISRIDPKDPAAFALLKRCETTAVFQLESRGMKELIKKLQPDCFDDITALVALFRPGPLQSGMVDDFIDRKHGRAKVEYPHPDLEPILKPTYGVILYQEQVMQIAQVLAGYSLGGADLLRRAMGKKKPEEMAKQGEIFRKGAMERGVDEGTAKYIFDLMEKFAGYGFNKSHSAAYALVSYHTMYLKAHYPAAFMAAVLSADMDHTDKVVGLIEDTKEQHLKVNPPNVNASQYKFTIEGNDTVIYGLGAIKGVGEGAILGIVDERGRNGPYQDLFDFCRRVDLKKANRRVLESLIKAGALDGLGENRATLMAHLPLAIQLAEQHHASRAAGQIDLFAMDDQPAAPPPEDQLLPPPAEEWEDEERLRAEKETLGLYLTGHPIDRYESELKELGVTRITNLSLEDAKAASGGGWGKRNKGQSVLIAGLVVAVSHRKTQRGRMGSVALDDRTGRTEVILFGDTYETYRDNLSADKVLVISGNLSYDDYRDALSIRAEHVVDIDEAREQWAHRIQLSVDLSRLMEQRTTGAQLADQLKQLLQPFTGGNCQILLHYQTPQAESLLEFGQNWRIRPNDMLLRKLQKMFGEEGVKVSYRKPSFPSKEEQGESRQAVGG
jgi:DNA polymerase-3 subunit alpha